GSTELVAQYGGVKASVPVDVLFAERMAVEPSPLVLKEGEPAVEMKVKAFDYLGRELRDRTPFFRSKNQEVLSMGQDAAFPVNPGATQLEVLVDGLRQVIEVKVEPAKKKSARK